MTRGQAEEYLHLFRFNLAAIDPELHLLGELGRGVVERDDFLRENLGLTGTRIGCDLSLIHI